MIQYIYFVKCPNCEDEYFDFFDEAKDFALGCLSKKPVITQVEVNRNDFGECTDSSDLGTIWSWEDMMKDVSTDPELTTFTKSETIDCDDDYFNYEFDALDSSLDSVPDNFNPRDMRVSDAAKQESNESRKPIPEGMTIEQLVEAMEENEDTVECVCCQELYPKEDCQYNEKHGWICPGCADEVVECTWCEELYDRSQCRYEVDLGWLCSRCEAAIKSRGETLTFRENLNEETESPSLKDQMIELEYKGLTLEVEGKYHSPTYSEPGWSDEVEYTDDFIYEVDAYDVADTLSMFMTDEDYKDIPGGIDAVFETDESWEQFFAARIDALVEKYNQQLLNYYEDQAIEAAQDKFQTQYDNEVEYGRYHEHSDESLETSDADPLTETLEDEYEARLVACPNCNVKSFDNDTGICISCGFN